MQPDELFGITAYLNELYGERFAPLSSAMSQLWFDAMKHLDEDLVSQAVRRWARQHNTLAPSLDQILEQVDIVRDEQVRASRPRSTPKSVAEILREQVDDASIFPQLHDSDNTIFRKLMILLMERSCLPWQDEVMEWHDKLTLEARATQCYEWANQYIASNPRLAEELQYQGRAYAQELIKQQEKEARDARACT